MRSKASVCGRSLVGIAGSNAGGGMDVLSFVLCVVSATGPSLVQRSVVCLSVISKPQQSEVIKRQAITCTWYAHSIDL